MNHKTDKTSTDMAMIPPPRALLLCLKLLDTFRRSACDGQEITITDYMREAKERPSYHPKGQAADVRIKDMTSDIRQQMHEYSIIIVNLINDMLLKGKREELQYVAHMRLWDKEGQHFHFELDDGEPVSIEKESTDGA